MLRVSVVCVAITCALLISVGIDRLAGEYLNATGWFTALTPNLTELHDTSEFSYIATSSAQGVRDKYIVEPKPKDEYRVLVIGDSFTYGDGVPVGEIWVDKLEDTLENEGYAVDIINAGKPGATPIMDRQICKAYKDRYGIDAVIYGMYADDLGQSAYREMQLDSNPIEELVKVYLWPTLSRIGERVIGYERYPGAKPGDSVVVSTFHKQEVQKLLKTNPTIILSIDPSLREVFMTGKINPAVVLNGLRMPEEFTYVLDDTIRNFAMDAFELRLQRLRERCTQNLPVIVVFIPSSDMVSSFYFPFKEQLRYTMDSRLLTIDMDAILKPLMQKNGFHYVSVLSSFRSDECKDCYYPYDGHMTAIGNKRVAEVMVPFVKQILLNR